MPATSHSTAIEMPPCCVCLSACGEYLSPSCHAADQCHYDSVAPQTRAQLISSSSSDVESYRGSELAARASGLCIGGC